MTRWAGDPEAAAQALIESALDIVQPRGRVLLAEGSAALETAIAGPGIVTTLWRRRFNTWIAAQPAPPDGPFDCALLRLPKSRQEQWMAAAQCLGVLVPGGRLILYGGNDEGVRPLQKLLAEQGEVTALASRGHGRVMAVRRLDKGGLGKTKIADWRRNEFDGPAGGDWFTYPGLFAGGMLDSGTALLLAHLPPVSASAAVLDYGCGPGAISAAIRRIRPAVRLTLLDNDSVALVAAGENVPGADTVLGDRLSALGKARFDLIVSNPPLHAGFRADLSPLHRLIAEAPRHLSKDGVLLMVVLRRIALERAFGDAFGAAEIVADDGLYRVWRAGKEK